MTDLPTNAPSPRLCHIVKWPDFDGYGFNLHAEKVRQGQFIGKVDEKSPADVSGLKEGDRIVEVNGVNISNENHKQVVQRIKAVSNETRLLVIDATGDEWYKDHNIVIRGDQPNIIYGTSKRSPLPENNHHDQPSSEETQSNKSNTIETPPPPAHEEDRKSVGSSSCHSENSNQPQQEDSAQKEDEVVITVKPPTSSSADKEDICSSESDPRDDGDGNAPSTETPCTTENRPLEIPTIETPSPEPPCTEDTVEESSTTKSDPILEYDNVRFESEEEQKKEEEPIPPLKDSPPPTPPRESPLPSEDRRSLSSSASGGSCEKAKPQSDGGLDAPPPEAESEQPEETRKSPMSTTPSPPPSLNPDGSIASQQNSTTENSTAPSTHSGLNLNMTAAEMRAHLATRKKFDPRNDQIDLKKKYQIVQNM